jgi:hypothetical protein
MTHTPQELAEELVPIDPAEFRFVWALAMEAVARRLPTFPMNYKLRITDLPQGPTTFAIGDTVDGRAMIAAKEHFEPDKAKLMSFMARFYEVIALLQHPAMVQWLRDEPSDPENLGINLAVLDAASTHPLTRLSGFDRTTFFEAVAARAAAMDAG